MRKAIAIALSAASLSFAAARVFAHDGLDYFIPRVDGLALTHVVLTGAGENTYQSVPDWCQMPPDRKELGSTHGGIVQDKAGNVYASMDGGPTGILVYKPDGTFVKGIGDKSLTHLHGININEENGEEFIYAAHVDSAEALKLKLDGTVVWRIPWEEFQKSGKYKDKGQLKPTGITVAPDGSVFVADGYGLSWVHKFDKDQKYVMSFGGIGTEPGQFKTCHGIGLDKRGERPLLLVCDRENRRLQHFDLDGKFVKVIAENLRRPCSVSFHGDNVAVAELEARVTILDKDNKEIAHLGDNPNHDQWAKFPIPPAEWKPGIFTAPHGVSFDHTDGSVYVMDWNVSGRLSKFKHVTVAGANEAAKQASVLDLRGR